MVRLHASVIEGAPVRIRLTGTYDAPGHPADQPIFLQEGSDSYTRAAWRELVETALAYPGGKVTFVLAS